jgi:hypothetical protein
MNGALLTTIASQAARSARAESSQRDNFHHASSREKLFLCPAAF